MSISLYRVPAVLLALALACAHDSAFQANHPRPSVVDTAMPAHKFTPRPHTPRAVPRAIAVAYSAVPRAVQSARCVDAGAVPEARPSAQPHLAKSSRVPYSPKAPTRSRAPAQQPARDDRAVGGSVGEVVSAEPARPADEAPSAHADDAAFADADMEEEVDTASGAPPRPSDSPAKTRRRRSRRGARAPATESPSAIAPVVSAPEPPPAAEGWGVATYLSNDDSMSLSSAQRVIFAVDHSAPIRPSDVRPHELLNYFSFATARAEPGHDFAVRAELAPASGDEGLYRLALTVGSRPVGRGNRRNAVVTLVVDRSGSMKAEGRMDYLKRGLLRMTRELKDGDIVHLVAFDHRVCVPLRNFVVGRDDPALLTKAILRLRPAGNTNIEAGLRQGYALADATYQPSYSNRVLLVTDALANTGDTNPSTLSLVSDWYDSRRIRLSGIGVGREFNDALLDRLTETGRGAYVYLGSEAEVDAVFGDRFVSLVETVANDVHFRLHLPPSLRMRQFFGEQSSVNKAEVQAIHFFADTSQTFLAELEAWQGQLRGEDDIMVEIDYQHPESGELMVEEYAFNLGGASEQTGNVRKAELVTAFVQGIGRQAARGAPSDWQSRPGTWQDAEGLTDCARTREQLADIAADPRDREVARVRGLWDRFCARYEGPGGPRPGRKDAWPSSR